MEAAGLAGITIRSPPRSLLARGLETNLGAVIIPTFVGTVLRTGAGVEGRKFIKRRSSVGGATGGRLAACACAILSSPGFDLFIAMSYSWRFWWSSRSPHLICNKFLRNLRYHTFHCHPHFRGHYLRRHCSWPHTQLWHCSTLLWQGGHC